MSIEGVIARRQIGAPDLPDLTPQAQAFHDEVSDFLEE